MPELNADPLNLPESYREVATRLLRPLPTPDISLLDVRFDHLVLIPFSFRGGKYLRIGCSLWLNQGEELVTTMLRPVGSFWLVIKESGIVGPKWGQFCMRYDGMEPFELIGVKSGMTALNAGRYDMQLLQGDKLLASLEGMNPRDYRILTDDGETWTCSISLHELTFGGCAPVTILNHWGHAGPLACIRNAITLCHRRYRSKPWYDRPPELAFHYHRLWDHYPDGVAHATRSQRLAALALSLFQTACISYSPFGVSGS
jgi:hypothetical protein